MVEVARPGVPGLTVLPPTYLDVRASYATYDREENFTLDYHGTKIWKLAADLDRYRHAIKKAAPDVLVECGTKWGGFAAWAADTFGIDVITIDVAHTHGRPEKWPRVTFIIGDTLSPTTQQQVRALVGDRRAMVSLDSDHHAPHVRLEIQAYGPVVAPGCHLVVEDGLVDLVPAQHRTRWGEGVLSTGGPLVAISQTLMTSSAWERDEEIERLTDVTHSPAGWWLRRA